MSEKHEQLLVKRLYRSMGGVIYDLSQPRRTMQTPGITDLVVFWPSVGITLAHEVKTPQGVLSQAQREFMSLCHQCPVLQHTVGGVDEGVAFLKQVGVVHGLYNPR